MAPVRLNETVWPTDSEKNMIGAIFGSVAFVLLIIICGCGKKKRSKINERKEEVPQSVSPEVKNAESEPQAKQDPTGKLSSGVSERKPKKTTSSKAPKTLPAGSSSKEEKKSREGPSSKRAKEAPSVKVPPKTSLKIAVASKKAVADAKSLQLKKLAPSPAPITPKAPTPVFLPKASETPLTPISTPSPKAVSARIAVKSPHVPASPATTTPTPTPTPSTTPAIAVSDEKEGPVEFLEIVGDTAATTITPQGGVSPAAKGVTPIMKPKKVPKSEHVRSDDPAYRSLVGLDDAFGGKSRVGQEGDPDKLMGTSMLPAFTTRSITNLPSESAPLSMFRARKHESDESKYKKKKPKKKK